MPVGMPKPKICLDSILYRRIFLSDSLYISSVKMRARITRTAHTAHDITVASATPATFISKTNMNIRFKTTLITPEIKIYINGRLVSPTARKIDAPKLYTRMGIIPPKYILIYVAAKSITSSGVPIRCKICLEKHTPKTIIIIPHIMLSATEACTALCIDALLPAPYFLEHRILQPTEMPIASPVIRFTTAPTEPTAARASLPTYRPTTITSAALNSSWNIFDNISGIQNLIRSNHILPSVIFISNLFFNLFLHPSL